MTPMPVPQRQAASARGAYSQDSTSDSSSVEMRNIRRQFYVGSLRTRTTTSLSKGSKLLFAFSNCVPLFRISTQTGHAFDVVVAEDMGNPRFTFPFTERQLKANALVPKFASVPAIAGSLFIVQHVLRSKKRRGRVYHRILLMMSAHDFLFSLKNFSSTWPIPKSTMIYGSSGTQATCTAAGFLGHGSALTSICYNFSLTLFFVLVVRFGWKDERIRSSHVELFLHGVPMLIGWSTAIAGLPLKLYNPLGWTCWINTSPPGCIDNETCLRGDNAGIYSGVALSRCLMEPFYPFRWAFFHAELWIVYAFTVVAMIMIYHSVVKQERTLDRYNFRSSVYGDSGRLNGLSRLGRMGSSIFTSGQASPSRQIPNDNDRSRSTQFAHQAMLYVIVFFFTWFFPMLQAVFALKNDVLYFPLNLLSGMLSSFQGFSNAVIYLRPRWKRFRKRYPSISSFDVLKRAIMGGELGKGSKRWLVDGQPSASGKAVANTQDGDKNDIERRDDVPETSTDVAFSEKPDVIDRDKAAKECGEHPRVVSLLNGIPLASPEEDTKHINAEQHKVSDDVTQEDVSGSVENRQYVADEQYAMDEDEDDYLD